MRRTLLVSTLLAVAWPALPQVAAPNAVGVSMGHLHLNVRDVEAHRRFWTALGGRAIALGTLEGIAFPGVLVFWKQAESAGGSEGSAIGHAAFKVRDLDESVARWKAAGIGTHREPDQGKRQLFVTAPGGVQVEITEDTTLDVPIAHHHVHLYGSDVEAARAWYVKLFGATPGKRGPFEAADIPGANLTFSKTAAPATPTKGRTLDHIGFEVRDLAAFCKKLEAAGVKLDIAYRPVPALGISIAFLTDPWGAYVELTEGLASVK